MNYVKGIYVRDIFSNIDNGYVVGILKVLESDIEDIDNNIYFVGNFVDLRFKNNYIKSYTNELVYASATFWHCFSLENIDLTFLRTDKVKFIKKILNMEKY